MKCLLALCVFVPAAVLALNCTGKADGNYEIGCRSYATCTNGQFIIVPCKDTLVYNSNTQKCDEPANVAAPCGKMVDCTNKQDGHYADTDQNCKSYYTCAGGQFLGHNFCPAGLVFNADFETCDWPADTKPPCGTKTGP